MQNGCVDAEISVRVADQRAHDAGVGRQIVERMLTNLMGNAREKQDAEVMLRYVQGLVAVNRESGAHRWFRAILYFQTSRLEDALQDVAWLRQTRPPEVEQERVEELETLIRGQMNPRKTVQPGEM